jgi:hypothetical protein
MKQNYQLDKAFICSVALEGGLKKYRDILPALPDMKFVSDWNRALISTLRRPEFKKQLGPVGRAVVMLNNPKMTAAAVDRLAVPYRSYYYARRFADAYKHVRNMGGELVEFGKNSFNLVDFSRGFSPLLPLICEYCDHVVPRAIENNAIINDAYQEASHAAGIGSRHTVLDWNGMRALPDSDKDIFVSLGTFVYMPKGQQKQKLIEVNNSFKSLYIELEQDFGRQKDSKIVESMGGKYQEGWSLSELRDILGPQIKIKTQYDGLSEFARSYDKKLDNSLYAATEIFIQR